MAYEENNNLKQAAGAGTGMTFAFIAGTLIGAAAGILLAPQPGRESRNRLRQYLRKAQDRMGRVAEEVGAAAGQAGRRAESMASTAADAAERYRAQREGD